MSSYQTTCIMWTWWMTRGVALDAKIKSMTWVGTPYVHAPHSPLCTFRVDFNFLWKIYVHVILNANSMWYKMVLSIMCCRYVFCNSSKRNMRYFSSNFTRILKTTLMLLLLYTECKPQMNESILGKVTHDTLSLK